MQIRSLVGELRSHKPCDMAKKKERERETDKKHLTYVAPETEPTGKVWSVFLIWKTITPQCLMASASTAQDCHQTLRAFVQIRKACLPWADPTPGHLPSTLPGFLCWVLDFSQLIPLSLDPSSPESHLHKHLWQSRPPRRKWGRQAIPCSKARLLASVEVRLSGSFGLVMEDSRRNGNND